tara:strand:- start:1822 stop:2418 length:597 start_codon:yes stop_codon:yes gene_type:complete
MNKAEINELQSILQRLFEFQVKVDTNLLHNYKWREVLQAGAASEVFPGFESTPGVNGIDFTSSNVTKGELKSCKGRKLKNGNWSKNSVKFEFDKQNDNIRRVETLRYNGLMFSMFHNEKIVFNFVIKSPTALRQFTALATYKQQEFIKEMNQCKAANKKLPRDTIVFYYNDLLAITNAEYYINGKRATTAQFKQLFGE